MSDIAEGLGGVVEGALAGGAVEPARGGKAQAKEAGDTDTCLNCGAHAPGKFCPNCGQKTTVHRSLAAIGHDIMHGVLHLDGKLWRTLPMLAFKPGKLTRRYIDGERASFVSPMAMFLFSVFAMFAVFQMIGLTPPTDLDVGDPAELVFEQGKKEASELRERIEAMPESDPEREQLVKDLAVIEGFLERAENGTLSADDVVEEVRNASQEAGSEAPSEFLDEFAEAVLSNDTDVELNVTGNEAFDQGILKKWRDNPGLMLYKLQANAYKFSWLLIPISLPFVWLVFAWRRRFKLYDHAIFVTYSLSFISLLFITVSLLGNFGAGAQYIVLPLLIIPPVHIYKQLRGTYALSRFSAAWRLFVLMFFILIILALFLNALLFLGAF